MTTHNTIKQSVAIDEISNFHKEHAKILISRKEEGYYSLVDIPKIFKQLDTEAAEKLINHIMQRFLDRELLEDLKIFCDCESIVFSVDDYEFLLEKYIDSDRTWKSIVTAVESDHLLEFYKPYIDPNLLMIHVWDVIQIFKDYGLEEVSKKLSSVIYQPISKNFSKQKRNQEIIKRYQEIKKENLDLSDEKIAEEIKRSAKKDIKKTKNKKTVSELNEKITRLETKTIVDVISDYYGKLIKKRYKEHQKSCKEIRIPWIAHYIICEEQKKLLKNNIETNSKNFDGLNGAKYHESESIINLIKDLYAKRKTKPTTEQVVEMLFEPVKILLTKMFDKEFVTHTAQELHRTEHSVRSIIINLTNN